MTEVGNMLLTLMRCALHGETAVDPGFRDQQWNELFRLAENQKVLPLLLDTAYRFPSLHQAGFGAEAAFNLRELQKTAIIQIARQSRQEN